MTHLAGPHRTLAGPPGRPAEERDTSEFCSHPWGIPPRILALAAGCSVLVETAQYVLRLDRASSVDDVLLNAAGAGLAALASRRWWRDTRTSPVGSPAVNHQQR
ncbi:VanZ family protein [Micromonospora sp. NPDC049089]|uniref:VanZ family protein n=1 Tax=unclassified Micromonospora TaxID=2617518 RepID=UPI0033DA1DDD